MPGAHSKCLDGSMTVTTWRRDNLIAADRPAKLPPTMAMHLRLSVMGWRFRASGMARSMVEREGRLVDQRSWGSTAGPHACSTFAAADRWTAPRARQLTPMR